MTTPRPRKRLAACRHPPRQRYTFPDGDESVEWCADCGALGRCDEGWRGFSDKTGRTIELGKWLSPARSGQPRRRA